MASLSVIDEMHITLLVPTEISTTESEMINQTITDPSFTTHIRKLIRRLVRQHPVLDKVRVRISR